MGHARAVYAGREAAGAAPQSGSAGGCRGPALHLENGLPVASVAARFSQPLDGAALLLCVANRWAVGTDQFRPATAGPRTGWPRATPGRKPALSGSLDVQPWPVQAAFSFWAANSAPPAAPQCSRWCVSGSTKCVAL